MGVSSVTVPFQQVSPAGRRIHLEIPSIPVALVSRAWGCFNEATLEGRGPCRALAHTIPPLQEITVVSNKPPATSGNSCRRRCEQLTLVMLMLTQPAA